MNGGGIREEITQYRENNTPVEFEDYFLSFWVTDYIDV
jgi:hypothetical protein